MKIQLNSNNNEAILLDDFIAETLKYKFKIKKGFVFDGASIPKLFWNVIGSPFTGKYKEAALVHDALYASEYFKRKECDDIFLDLMERADVGYFKRYTMYWAVRIGGDMVWSKHRYDDVKKAKEFINVKVK